MSEPIHVTYEIDTADMHQRRARMDLINESVGCVVTFLALAVVWWVL